MSARGANGWTRRDSLRALLSGAIALGAPPASLAAAKSRSRVVVVGGGYGGATAAKYLRAYGEGAIDVTLVEENSAFVSCPLSNLVLGGSKTIADVTVGYGDLSAKHGVRLVKDRAVGIDPVKREVRLAQGSALRYDRLILSPGVDFRFDRIPALTDSSSREKVLHAWKAGPQTVALRHQLEAMRDGGVFAISIPRSPYRCPPAPYERACQVAWYFQRAKPKSKVLILDANEEVQSKKALFTKAFNGRYKDTIEYQPDSVLTDVDVKTLTAKFELADDVRADVLNVIPPQGAGEIARRAGVITANDQWCEVDFLSFESIAVKNVHVLGDSIQVAPLMPKSGHMANQQAKVCASAIVALLSGSPVNPEPVVNNTCYSFITDRDVMHVASVHRYDPSARTFVTVPGSGGLSADINDVETPYAFGWAQSIWADMLG